jgi:fumarate hydratase subunit beta
VIKIETPLKKDVALSLNAGDQILLNGIIFTSRDTAHRFLLASDFEKIRGATIFHCGPVVRDNVVVSAGPTTSSRMNKFTPGVVAKYDIRAIIGKGGMDQSVLEALKGRAVYLAAVGGAAAIYAKHIKVRNVYKLEFGMPEAIWEFHVSDFPVMVAMDSKGRSLYADVYAKSKAVYQKLTR